MLFFNLDTEEKVTEENTPVAEETKTESVEAAETQEAAETPAETPAETLEVTPEETPAEQAAVAQEDGKIINAMGYEETEEAPVTENKSSGAAEAVKAAAKKIAGSKTMAVSVIAYTVCFVFGVLFSFALEFNLDRFMVDITTFANTLETGYVFTPVETTSSVSSIIFGMAVEAFVLFALWHVYCQGKKKEGKPFGTTGATIIQIYAIVGAALAGFFALLFGLISGLLSVTNAALTMLSVPDISVLSVIFGVIVIVYLLIVLYYVLVAHSASSFKKALKTDTPVAKGSGYAGVVLVLCGVMNILAFCVFTLAGIVALVGLGVAGMDASVYVPAFLALELVLVSGAVSYMGFGTLMFRYKKSMKKIRAEFKK